MEVRSVVGDTGKSQQSDLYRITHLFLVSTYLEREDHTIQSLNHSHYRCKQFVCISMYLGTFQKSSGFLAGHDGGDVPRHGP